MSTIKGKPRSWRSWPGGGTPIEYGLGNGRSWIQGGMGPARHDRRPTGHTAPFRGLHSVRSGSAGACDVRAPAAADAPLGRDPGLASGSRSWQTCPGQRHEIDFSQVLDPVEVRYEPHRYQVVNEGFGTDALAKCLKEFTLQQKG